MCDEFSFSAAENSATGGKALGSPTREELIVMAKEKREELKQAENEQKECEASIGVITRLRTQFTKNDAVVTDATRKVGKTSRSLRFYSVHLRRQIILWNKAVEEDKAARAALAEAVEEQEVARVNKEDAAATLRM